LLGLALSQIGFENSELDIFKKKISQFNFYTQKNKKTIPRGESNSLPNS
jgi:hypothetical protein